MEKADRMKVVLAGCGAIAPVHLAALIEYGIKIAALCDLNPAKAERLKQKFNLDCNIYTDFTEMLKSEKPFAVHVCTPHYLHAPMILTALNFGINVFTEKPLAITVDQLNLIQSAAQKSKGKVGVCFQNRYLPSNIEAKKLALTNIASDAFFNVVWSRDAQYYRDSPWRGNITESGGGALINQAIHTLDLLLWFLGDPEFITAKTENYSLKNIINVEDTASGVIEFKNASAVFYATTAAKSNYPVQIVLTGKSKIELSGNRLFFNEKEIPADNPHQTLIKEYWGNGHLSIIKDYYDCLLSEKAFPLDENEGAKAVKAVLKIYESQGARLKFN